MKRSEDYNPVGLYEAFYGLKIVEIVWCQVNIALSNMIFVPWLE